MEYLPNQINTIKPIGDPYKDFWTILPLMVHPQDEIKRAQFQAALVQKMLAEADPSLRKKMVIEWAEVLTPSIDLLFDCSPAGLLEEAYTNSAKAMWAGEILLKALTMDVHHGGASVKNAVLLTVHFCQGGKSRGGTDLQASERHLFNCWKNFRSVCHIAGAFLICSDQHGADFLMDVNRWNYFLILAQTLRVKGFETYAHGQKKPILDIGQMWELDSPMFNNQREIILHIPPFPERTISVLERLRKRSRLYG